LFLWSANLEKGRDLEYKKFIVKNLAAFKKHVPPGWKLRGVYGPTFYIGRYDVTWIWEFNRFSDLDVFRDFEDPVADKLAMEDMDFFVPGSFNSVILREVGDWNVLPPRKPKKSKK